MSFLTTYLFFISSCEEAPNELEPINLVELSCPLYAEPLTQNRVYYEVNPLIPDSFYSGGMLKSETTTDGWLYLGKRFTSPQISGPISFVEEILEEGTEHQIFFSVSDSLNINFEYLDQDENGNPIGIHTRVSTGNPSHGQLTITVLHKPDKFAPNVSLGDITHAKGEIDFRHTFEVTVY